MDNKPPHPIDSDFIYLPDIHGKVTAEYGYEYEDDSLKSFCLTVPEQISPETARKLADFIYSMIGGKR